MKKAHVVLACLICLMFGAAVVALFYVEPPAGAREPLLILIGVLGARFGSIVDYYFGSSAGSAEKNNLLANK
jgi:membrane protein YqaA with SNARE-associated domain